MRGLRIVPGDASSAQAYRAKNRVRRLQIALGPAPEQRFDVELPPDAAGDAARFRDPYWVAFPKPIATSCVTVIVTDVVPGGEAAPPRNLGTTAISELTIFTDVDGPGGTDKLVADLAKAPDCASRLPLIGGLGDPAVLPVAQAVMTARGSARECLVEALTTLAPTPKSPIVVAALTSAIGGASAKEERMVGTALRPRHPRPGRRPRRRAGGNVGPRRRSRPCGPPAVPAGRRRRGSRPAGGGWPGGAVAAHRGGRRPRSFAPPDD